MPADIQTDRYALWYGDCRDALAELPANYCDSVITDPPYHLTAGKKGGSGPASVNLDTPAGRARIGTGHDPRDYRRASPSKKQREKIASGSGFMGLSWDGGDIAFDPALWSEVLRVCKPGAFLLAFGGSRTFHRLACAIEDAGWELRDTVMFLHSMGFPKGFDISKAIDAKLGKTREVVGSRAKRGAFGGVAYAQDEWTLAQANQPISLPASLPASLFDGWNVALKPAFEPILVCMKPLDGTFASNALKWGTAGLNIDGARVPVNGQRKALFGGAGVGDGPAVNGFGSGLSGSVSAGATTKGRWPANVILSHNEDCRCVGTRPAKGDNRTGKQGTRPGGFGDVGAGSNGTAPCGPLYGDGAIEVWECSPGCAVALLDMQANSSTLRPCRESNQHGDISPNETVGGIAGGENREVVKSSPNLKAGGRGSKQTGQFQKDTKSTTKTSTTPITPSTTLNVLPRNGTTTTTKGYEKITEPSMESSNASAKGAKSTSRSRRSKHAPAEHSKDTASNAAAQRSQNGEQKTESTTTPTCESTTGNVGIRQLLESQPSRFFYTAKPRAGERNLGLADGRQNHHPTLKSLSLLEYLCTLTATPTGGIVLDPFAGSFTCGMAAMATGRQYLGMELGKDYFLLGMERMAWAAAQPVGQSLGRKNRGKANSQAKAKTA